MSKKEAVFSGVDSSGHTGLWVTDGTAAGTIEISDISGDVDSFASFGTRVILTSGADLVVTNGTSAGTTEFSLPSADGTAVPDANFGYAMLPGAAFFIATVAGTTVLYETNGTQSGTQIVPLESSLPSNATTIRVSAEQASSQTTGANLVAVGSKVVFSMAVIQGGSYGLWVTDGTASGTNEILDNGYEYNVSVSSFMTLGSKALFVGIDYKTGIGGTYITDGTAAGTSLFNVPGLIITEGSATLFNGYYYFAAQDTSGDVNLWRSNGTVAGTSEIIAPGQETQGLAPEYITVYGSELLFIGLNSSGQQVLWTSNGTSAGTKALTVTGLGLNDEVNEQIYVSGTLAYFEGQSSLISTVWSTNGTAAGTTPLLPAANDAATGAGFYYVGLGFNFQPTDFATTQSGVVFQGTDVAFDDQLWVTNGTSSGTNELLPSGASSGGLDPQAMTTIGGDLTPGDFTADDFAGAGRSDLLLQNTNGTINIFSTSASGLVLPSAVSVGDPGSTWHVVGTADLNGDGQPDLLLQNDNGTILDFLMSGTGITAGYALGSVGSSWHVRGTADFIGDGNTDILVQSDSGSMVLFETNGQSLIGSSFLGSLPAGWAVEGIGDFYGTGQPDLLVESTGGTLVIYTMSGATVTAGQLIGTVGTGWSVAGVADYNGDGKADIVLHNDNGSNVLFYMSGAGIVGSASLGNPGAGFTNTVVGLDLNGDTVPDLVVQNTATTLVGYTLNANAQITAGAVLGTPGAGWNVVGSNPTTFIDGTGANLTLAATPGADEFNLTSYTAGIHSINGFDPALDSVALSAAAFPSYAAVQANEAPYLGGTFINLSPTAAIVITGVTPSHLSAANFVLR